MATYLPPRSRGPRETWSVLSRLKELEVDVYNIKNLLAKSELRHLGWRRSRYSGLDDTFDSIRHELHNMSDEADRLSYQLSKFVDRLDRLSNNLDYTRREKIIPKEPSRRVHWLDDSVPATINKTVR